MSKLNEQSRKFLMAGVAVSGLMMQANATHLSADMIERAWKSEEYRQSLTAEQQALLPENPVGNVQLGSHELLASTMRPQGTCDMGCPCSTASADCSGTAGANCSNTAAADCSNTAAADCSNTAAADCG